MRIRVLNRFWNLRFAPNLANRGDCDPPDKRGKEIRISTALRGEERLEVVIHELVHYADCRIMPSAVANARVLPQCLKSPTRRTRHNPAAAG